MAQGLQILDTESTHHFMPEKQMNSDSPLALAGQWALVTGSSSGIGRAIALELAAAGANVIVHGFRKHEAARQLTDTIRKMGKQSEFLLGDLAQPGSRQELVEQSWKIAPLDILVNNAGVDVLTGDAADWSFARKLESLWQVDVAATIELSRTIGALMKARGHGAIVNLGWDQAATGMEGDSGEMFAASKGAVMAFTRSVAKSLAPQVRVDCVAPGWIKTEWGAEASDYWQQRATGEALLQRWGTPEDIAHAVRFLVSPESSFITGQVLNVNGGR